MNTSLEKRPIFDPTEVDRTPNFSDHPSEKWLRKFIGEDYSQLVNQRLYSLGLLEEGKGVILNTAKEEDESDERCLLYHGIIGINLVSVCLLKNDGMTPVYVNYGQDTDFHLLKGSLDLTLYDWESGEDIDFVTLTEEKDHTRVESAVHYQTRANLALYLEVNPFYISDPDKPS